MKYCNTFFATKFFYPKLTHITYMAHGLHRIPKANKIFLKAPAQVNTFKEMCPN